MNTSHPPIDHDAVSVDVPAPRLIGRRIALAFALVSLVAIAMCVLLLSVVAEMSGLVGTMHEDEVAMRESFMLSAAVREQYIHQAHTIIEGADAGHIGHYEEWLVRIERGVQALRSRLDVDAGGRIDTVLRNSRALDKVFHEEVVPARRAMDWEALTLHHKVADSLSSEAVAQADSLARHVEARMARAHDSATRVVETALLGTLGCVALILLLSVASTFRLRKLVLRPLEALAASARRIGAGDFETRVGPIGRGELGAVAGAFDAMARELSKREAKLLQAERMATVGQLAAGVAHEINNPIGIIRGYLKTMMPEAATETLRAELAILDEEAEACQRIAADLLDYARLPEIEIVRFDIKQLLSAIASRFQDVAGRPVRIAVAETQIEADAGRVQQVVRNLLMNADQHSPSGAAVDLNGELTQDGSYVISVCDSGPGVPDCDRQRIFEPFYTRGTGGTGLGLALCRGIAEAHGGRMEVQSRDGGGSCFRLVLPSRTQVDT